MKEELQVISCEQAKRLKELGFDKEVRYIGNRLAFATPISFALKWFRDKWKIPSSVNSVWTDNIEHIVYRYCFWESEKGNHYNHSDDNTTDFEEYSTYELAESALLDALLEYCEEKKLENKMLKKIEIKNISGAVLYSHECKGNTIKITLEKAVKEGVNLSYTDLSGSDLSGSDLFGCVLSNCNLSGSDLSFSDLSYADLSFSDLFGCNLSYSNLQFAMIRDSNMEGINLRDCNLNRTMTDKWYVSVACIGSEKRKMIYCFEDDIIWCGCFTGSLSEFEKKVEETHKDSPQYLKEYKGFIEYIKMLKKEK